MSTRSYITNLAALREAQAKANANVSNWTPEDGMLELIRRKGALRKANEALRVFCYKSKHSLTASGRMLRH